MILKIKDLFNKQKIIIFLMTPLLLATVQAQATFKLVLTHPHASTQPTTTGKVISALKAYQNSVYIGYGDAGVNTGPIQICRFVPPSTNLLCEFTLSTERLSRYQILGGKLYALSTDPSSPNQHAYAVKNGSSAWTGVSRSLLNQGPIPPAHIFDMVSFGGSLWAVGSQHTSSEINVPPYAFDGDATVWRSTDNGSSWSVSLDIHQIDNCCARIYLAGVQGNKLYIQAVDYDERHPVSKVFNGSSWSNGPDLFANGSATKGAPFGDNLLMIQWGNLASFNGTSVNTVYSRISDYIISAGYVYVLTPEKSVYRSNDLNTWSFVDSLNISASATSIEVNDLIIYVGTSNSKIYKSDILNPPPCVDNCGAFIPAIILLLSDDEE